VIPSNPVTFVAITTPVFSKELRFTLISVFKHDGTGIPIQGFCLKLKHPSAH
jgi:hypothetical protein